MPATLAAYRLTQTWRRQIIAQRDRATRRLLTLGLSTEAIVAIVSAAQRDIVAPADLFIANYLTVESGEVRSPTGLDASVYVTADKTAAAARTARDRYSAADLRRSVFRFVETDISWAARTAQRDAMTAAPEVVGWRRMTGSDPCPLCRRLADGSVLPPEVDVATHPTCSCIATPAVRGRDDRYVPPTFEESRDG